MLYQHLQPDIEPNPQMKSKMNKDNEPNWAPIDVMLIYLDMCNQYLNLDQTLLYQMWTNTWAYVNVF